MALRTPQFQTMHSMNEFRRQRTRLHLFLLINAVAVLGFTLGITLLLRPGQSEATSAVIDPLQDSLAGEIRMAEVIVPTVTINPGEMLDGGMFTTARLPVIGLPSRAVKTYEGIRGQFARVPLIAGAPISDEMLTSVRPSSGLSAQIPPGYRAVTITVDITSGVEGWVRPGARVDVALMANINRESGMVTVARNVKVISAARRLDNEFDHSRADVPSTVTLLVTESDAAKIHLASTAGRLSLSLRGEADTGVGTSGNAITVKDLLRGAGENQSARRAGTIKMKNKDGSVEEFALVEGKLEKVEE